jgi:hypothetical protein
MNIYDYIESIVDDMQTAVKILSITDNTDGTFDIELSSLNSLFCSVLNIVADSYVNLAGTGKDTLNYKVNSVSGTTIVISEATGFDFTGYTDASGAKPYYSFEKWRGEANKLNVQALSAKFVNQKFPRVFLLLNAQPRINGNTIYESFDSLSIYIMEKTLPNKNAQWRLDNIFKPTLFKLVNIFKHQLECSREFIENEDFAYAQEDLFFMGTEDQNQNKLNQYVEAVRIDINNLTIYNPNNSDCKQTVNL